MYNLLNFWTDGPDASNASSKKLFVESGTLNKLELYLHKRIKRLKFPMSVIVRRICLWKLLPRFARGRLGEVWVAATFVCGDTQFWICTSGHGPIFLQSNTGKEYFHNPISCPYKENWTCLGQFGHS